MFSELLGTGGSVNGQCSQKFSGAGVFSEILWGGSVLRDSQDRGECQVAVFSELLWSRDSQCVRVPRESEESEELEGNSALAKPRCSRVSRC